MLLFTPSAAPSWFSTFLPLHFCLSLLVQLKPPLSLAFS
jgi:hypothetical protein